MGKKEREIASIRLFKKVFQEFPQGEIEPSEEPDFLIRTPSGLLGIEVTRLHRDTPEGKSLMQEQEGLQTQILRGAKSYYEREGNPHIQVTVHFDTAHRFRKSDVDPLANQIVRIVLDEMLAKGVCVMEEDEDNCEWWPHPIVSVVVFRHEVLTKSYWTPLACEYIPRLGPDLVQAALDGKNLKVPMYRERCSKLWLLMVLEGSGMSSTVDIAPEVEAHRFRASFDRAFLLQCFEGKYLELRIGDPQTDAAPE